MAASIKFNLKQIADLNEDFRQSSKALPAVILKIVRERFKQLRRELVPGFSRQSGAMRKTFGYRVQRKRNQVIGNFGLFMGRRHSVSAIIAGNVQQHPGAMPKKGAFLWVPIGGNVGVGGTARLTPSDLIASGRGFVRDSKTGKRIAFQRLSDTIVPMFVLKRQISLRQAPVPFAQRVESELPSMLEEIPEFVQQVIVARKAAIGAISREAVT